MNQSMKTPGFLAAGLFALSLLSAQGQPIAPQQPIPMLSPPAAAPPSARSMRPESPERSVLTLFNLDFPGGTPQELVAAIQKATGKPLNAIIPTEHAHVQLPPLKMNNVDVPRLFQALELASNKTTYAPSPYGQPGMAPYQAWNTSYGFKTSGTQTDDSIWYFRDDKPAAPPLIPTKICHFYSLATYLERGLTVDDITTAIQTGWKMLGDGASTPTISFHKETKLLIAVGEPSKLETIDAVLKALDKALEPPKPKPIIDPTKGVPPAPGEPKAKK